MEKLIEENETIDKLKEAKKILQEAEETELKECTEAYNVFLTQLQSKYNVKLNVEGRFLNNQLDIAQFFTKIK